MSESVHALALPMLCLATEIEEMTKDAGLLEPHPNQNKCKVVKQENVLPGASLQPSS